MNPDLKRLNLWMNVELVNRVDEFGKSMGGISRSAAFSVIISQYFQQQDNLQVAGNLMEYMRSNDFTALVEMSKNDKGNQGEKGV